MTRNESAQLMIRFAPGVVRPLWSRGLLNEYRGGPEILLEWIETQLGLPITRIHQASRVSEFAAALDAANNSMFAESLKADRWATASELLSRRDELLMSGWNEKVSDAYPALVQALAMVLKGRTFQFPGEAERLQRVLDAIDAGQVLPPHRCLLYDAKEAWPLVWQKVLEKLNVSRVSEQIAHAPEGSALQKTQTVLLGGAMKGSEMTNRMFAASLSALLPHGIGGGSPVPHLQSLRNPFPRHGRFRPQPRGRWSRCAFPWPLQSNLNRPPLRNRGMNLGLSQNPLLLRREKTCPSG